ncbi:hypothetical protein GXW74_23445 [Roseomonas eburnea]|uniref:Uncharacterized protein n=1 Tax=Neoroseomonas eburnea TaxID=1346889 RepID=A0A9X9XIC5_9PROT|nr:hypothetical protein [Neoroseomonas eburnea]MBR0683461.1 hypothetical protein [Neoroseomonas eburnea]
MPALAARMNDVSISASLVMTMKARELAAKGIKVISLASGAPDSPTPMSSASPGFPAWFAAEGSIGTGFCTRLGAPALVLPRFASCSGSARRLSSMS